MGLREAKKEQTRRVIAETAWRMFIEQGFERVTVTDIARAASVAPATVFNYFATKEDLFFWRLDVFGERLVGAVRDRASGESALDAVRSIVVVSDGLLTRAGAGDDEALARLRSANRVIAESPALQAREARSFAAYTESLAELLAAETGEPTGDVIARVAATAMIGVQRALVLYVRRRLLDDDRLDQLAEDVRRLGNEAFDLLERGLGSD